MSADEYIRQSILDPEAYFELGYRGVASRSFDRPLSQESVDLMVAYLLSLKETDTGNGHSRSRLSR
jgi:hypothetical protein